MKKSKRRRIREVEKPAKTHEQAAQEPVADEPEGVSVTGEETAPQPSAEGASYAPAKKSGRG